MIRYRNGAYEVIVNIGVDPKTGTRKRASRSIRMPERKRIPREVLDVEAELRTKVKAGELGGPQLTVAELLDRWLDGVRRDLSPLTVHGYERKIDLYLRPTIGKLRLEKLTTARIDRLYQDLRAHGGQPKPDDTGRLVPQPLAPATVRHAHAVLHRALQDALRYRWIPYNPATHARVPTIQRYDVKVATLPELEQLITTARTAELALLIALAAGTGCRRGELCGLRWSDVDVDDQVVAVRRNVVEISHKVIEKAPKSGRGRVVPIGPNLVAALRARRAEQARRALAAGVGLLGDGYVLSDELDASRPLHPNVASDRFRAHARRQGIALRLHDCRHAKASHAMAAGIAAVDVAEGLGHASAKMTLDVYGHSMPEGLRRMGDVLDLVTPRNPVTAERGESLA